MTVSFPSAPGGLLQQALVAHQQGRLADAERLYRQSLHAQPGSSDVQLNLATVLMGQGKLDEAAVFLRQALAGNPDNWAAHYQLGNIFALQGKMADAAGAYRRATELKPDHAEAFNNLGNTLLQQGLLEDAASAYRKAVDLRADYPEALTNLAGILLGEGKASEALEVLRRAVAARPGYAEAHNNLGNTFSALGQLDDAVAAYRRAAHIRPTYAEAYNNLGTAYLRLGQQHSALAAFRRVMQLVPNAPEAHNNLGNAFKGLGQLAEAEACYRRAIALRPGYAEAHNHLGMVVCEQDRIGEAFELFTQAAKLWWQTSSPIVPQSLADPPPKIRHDAEQRAWLLERRAPAAPFRLESAPRGAGRVVNAPPDMQRIEQEWRDGKPQIVVIDNLLTQHALAELRNFCWGSTIWRRSHPEGYLGALPEHGFSPPLLAQIAEELRDTYPAIFRGHRLLHHWAFKYDSNLNGIKVHADFAAVNVNFWITPDEANLDPQRGGLVIWDVAAPLDWDFSKYNSADADIRAFLAREKAKSITVPYRSNRAVVFDSDLFHETDEIHFREGYENRRMNVTLLYGRRERASQLRRT